jgi:glycosyltransferase involved in cell wall biosynthesis
MQPAALDPRQGRSDTGPHAVPGKDRPLRILIIGTLPPPFGGATVLLRLLVDELLRQPDVEVQVLNTGRAKGSLARRALIAFSDAVRLFRSTDIVTLHLNRPAGAVLFLPLARLFGKPFVLRWFGGADYRNYGGLLRRKLVRWGFRHADLTLFETKRLVAHAKQDGARRVEWYLSGEGYPGAILEAFAAGIPVITTRWLSIPEIVDHSCGILIPPRNPAALADAVIRLTTDPLLYQRLCAGAVGKRGQFSSSYWTRAFVDYCRPLVACTDVRK